MFSNYVVMYNMKADVEKITKQSTEKFLSIIEDVQNKRINKINKSNSIINLYYNTKAKMIPTMDKDFNVSKECNSCGICKEVCPSENIVMINDKPNFQHHCEQCVACIQFCPKRAINYKNKTQKRRRYTNPNISFKELAKNNTKASN
jgi:ferredoxin